jgi:hypothetical protein
MVPIYVLRDGEMHFRSRYDLPPLVGVGLVRETHGNGAAADPDHDDGEAAAFRFLVGRLAVNIATSHRATAFAVADEDAWGAKLAGVLDDVAEVTR